MKVLSAPKRDLHPKDIACMVHQYLYETNMKHSAFCFRHEAKITRQANLEPNKLVSLLKKGFLLENLEKGSEEMLHRLDKQVRNYTSSSRKHSRSMSLEDDETLKREVSLKQYISGKIQSELNKLMEGSLSSMRHSRTTFSSSFSGNKDDLLPASPSYHDNVLASLSDQPNPKKPAKSRTNNRGMPEIAFRTGNFSKKKMLVTVADEMDSFAKQRKKRLSANVSGDFKKQLSQSKIEFGQYNSKFSFAQTPDKAKLQKFMFKTQQQKLSREDKTAYSFDGTSDAAAPNLTSFDALANMETSFFQKVDSHSFRCHEFRSHKHFLLCFDASFKKAAVLNMDLRLQGLGEGSVSSNRPLIFKISEELRGKHPRIVFDHFAIFYTQNEFIVFDYQ